VGLVCVSEPSLLPGQESEFSRQPACISPPICCHTDGGRAPSLTSVSSFPIEYSGATRASRSQQQFSKAPDPLSQAAMPSRHSGAAANLGGTRATTPLHSRT
jgi:hypothetical protein